MAGEKIGKRSEKTQFSVTCRLLSQYLKEKGSFGSIGLELAPWPIHHQPQEKHQAPTTLSLLPGVDVSTEDQTINNTDQNAPKSMELFPQHAGIDSESVRIPSNIKTEKAQLTIFYCGKVLVFDDFPADKAEDLLQMASKESIAAQKIAFTAPSSSTGADCSSQLETAHANASDMPIARKNSLHRFLVKRKDRISTKAPYQVHGGTEASDLGKPEHCRSWLGLGGQAVKQENSESS
ncbi:hypothetical protein C4D60_Mb06t31790 [Musa balbisiana]|uniref:Protein TIFY n=1 Tax=Musa balbisiana TaxID=52838 RepID=A0A4S8ISX5_MUSBA|nr:hypothetical protein C4D60_Mb06t31790 [Musa balbisiana]